MQNIFKQIVNQGITNSQLTAEEYLQRSFEIPAVLPTLPLEDEDFVAQWDKPQKQNVPDFLQERFQVAADCSWENPEALRLELVQTLGGRIPVITLHSHQDFCRLTSLLRYKAEAENFPLTVNAVTLHLRQQALAGHVVILLNQSPYSNVPADKLQLSEQAWLEASQRLRLRHECAHYECLRLFGGMQMHLLDELVADGMGQLAAFGNFSAARQRLFFGLKEGSTECTGRLTQYTRRVAPEHLPAVYASANIALERIETRLCALQQQQETEMDLFLALCSKNW